MSKTVFFYLDGGSHGEGLRVTIRPDRFWSLEALMGFLTSRLPVLPYGVRSIFSVADHVRIQSIDQLSPQGHYIASDQRTKPKGVKLDHKNVVNAPNWKTGRPPSGQRLFSYSLQSSLEGTSTGTLKSVRERSTSSRRRGGKEGKVIYVHQNGDSFHKHRIMVHQQRSLPHLLNEISFQLQSPVYKLYKLDGGEVHMLDDIFTGPCEYVAVGVERLRPLHTATSLNPCSKRSARPLTKNAVPKRPLGPLKGSHRSCSAVRSNAGLELNGHHSPSDENRNRLRPSRSNETFSDDGLPGDNRWMLLMTSGKMDTTTIDKYSTLCTANASITVQGTKGCTPLIPLSRDNRISSSRLLSSSVKRNAFNLEDTALRLFHPGKTDRFELHLGSIGEIVKIRISHDDSGSSPDLLLSKVMMRKLDSKALKQSSAPSTTSTSLRATATNVELMFNVSQSPFWLSKDRRETTKELASPFSKTLMMPECCQQETRSTRIPRRISPTMPLPESTHQKFKQYSALPLVNYRVEVHTGEFWGGAPNEAVAHLIIFGDLGDTGPRILWNSVNHPSAEVLKQNEMDIFTIEAVYLGRIEKIRIWLEGGSCCWHLDWMQVDYIDAFRLQSPVSVYFACGQWLKFNGLSGALDFASITSEISFVLDVKGQRHLNYPNKMVQLCEATRWKFKAGTELVFYSRITGAPLRIGQEHDLVEATPKATTTPTDDCILVVRSTDFFLASKFETVPMEIKQRREKRAKTVKYSLPVLQFVSPSNSQLGLAINNDGNLELRAFSVDDDNDNSIGGSKFTVQPHLDAWVNLELLRPECRHKINISPGGHKISINNDSPNSISALLMPYVKGCMRDHGIILLSTNSTQTLVARPPSERVGDGRDDKGCHLATWATGQRSPDAYWRVARVGTAGGGVRTFEALAAPGRFLRIVGPGECDVMGNGNSSCHFRLHRIKATGVLQLESFQKPGLFVYILSNGLVTASSDSSRGGNINLRPEVIEYGIRKCYVSSEQSRSQGAMAYRRHLESIVCQSEKDDVTSSLDVDSIEPSESPRDCYIKRRGTIDKEFDVEADWKIFLHTSESAYNSLIVLCVYGEVGNSGSIILGASDNEKDLFRAGNVDEFKITLTGIGPIFKIRLEVNQLKSDELPYWGAQKVVFENIMNHDHLTFDFFGRPFVRTYGHCQLSREQVVTKSDSSVSSDLIPRGFSTGLDARAIGLVIYRLTLNLLRSRWQAGDERRTEDSLPQVSLFGQFGDTGRRLLPLTVPIQTSEEGSQDGYNQPLEVFESLIEAVYLGELQRCVVGPVQTSNEAGGLCTGINVVDPLTGYHYYFPASVWIGGQSQNQNQEVSLKPIDTLSFEEGSVSEVQSSDVEQLHKQVSKIIHKITDSATENVSNFSSWESTFS